MRLIWVAGILAWAGHAALAEGFAIRDLTQAPDMSAALGTGYIAKFEPDRVTYVCIECEGLPMIDVLMGQQTDGTEDRLRSGETTVEEMQAICQARDPACTLEGLDIAPAVGFISSYEALGKPGNTVVVMQGGDMLTIRSLADNADVARVNAQVLIDDLVPTITGQ